MYGKGFAAMYTGSMFGAGLHVFAVWNYAINNADRRGFVELNPLVLAATLGGAVEQIAAALEYLESPDPKSRSKAEGGRRMVRSGEYLYALVNYAAYRDMLDAEKRRNYLRVKQREHRAKPKRKRKVLTPVDSQPASTMSTHVEVEVEVEAEVEQRKEPSSASALAKVVVEADVVSWSRAACDDWISRFGGTAPGGQIGKALLPIVKRHGWDFVRKAWIRYLAQSEAQYASPSRFSATFGRWSGLAPDPAPQDDVTDHNARVLADYMRGREDGGLGGVVKSMPKLRGRP